MFFYLGQQNAYIWHMIVGGWKNECTKGGKKLPPF
jgi:hypothetical protein